MNSAQTMLPVVRSVSWWSFRILVFISASTSRIVSSTAERIALGIHPDIYIAEIAEEDSEGRVASPAQQEANGQLIVASPALLAACRMVIDRWEHGDLAEAARACHAAVAQATGAASIAPGASPRLAIR